MARTKQMHFRVSEQEYELIRTASSQFGTKSVSAFVRKIAIDGMIINLKLPELSDMISLLRRCSNNLNQIARRVNASGRIYDSEMEQLLQNQEELWQAANNILAKLASIK